MGIEHNFRPYECSAVIIDILQKRLPAVIEALELPKDTTEFSYFIKQIQIDPGDEFVKVVFTTDFNNKDYIWYFRAGIDG